jgi:MSHA biogenesis protein MshO
MKFYLNQTGFSLIELIVVMVLLGVLATGAGMLITTPIEAYNDQLRRQQLVDQAEMSLRHISSDIRKALPGSIRIQPNVATGGWALEMANIVDGARYRDGGDGSEVGGFNGDDDILEFDTVDTKFNFLGITDTPTPPNEEALPGNWRLVIYNLDAEDFYNGVTTEGGGIVTPLTTSLYLSDEIENNVTEQRLEMNPGFKFTKKGNGQRAYFIDGPISYICDPTAGSLVRYSDYPFQLEQVTTDGEFKAKALDENTNLQSGHVVTQMSACEIAVYTGAGALYTINMTLDDPNGEAIEIFHQVRVLNVP